MNLNLLYSLIFFLFIQQTGFTQNVVGKAKKMSGYSIAKKQQLYQQSIQEAVTYLNQTKIDYGKDHSFYAIAIGDLAKAYSYSLDYSINDLQKASLLYKEASKRIESILGKDNSMAIRYKRKSNSLYDYSKRIVEDDGKLIILESGPGVDEERILDENGNALDEEEKIAVEVNKNIKKELELQSLKKELAMLKMENSRKPASTDSEIIVPANSKWISIPIISKNNLVTRNITIAKDANFNQGSYLKQLNLTNKEYEFDFKLISSNDKGIDYDENGVLQIVANKGQVKLQVTNLSEKALYFYILKIDEQGKLSSFAPNKNCSLYGSKRLISAGITKVFENCTFSFPNPTENIKLKGIATELPINFELLLERNNTIDHEDFLSKQLSNMHTSEFVFKVTLDNKSLNKREKAPQISANITKITRTPILPISEKDKRIKQLEDQIKNLKRGPIVVPKKETTKILSEFTYHALLIAEEKYKDKKIGTLDYPKKDADSLKKVLCNFYTFDEDNIIILENPKQDDIEKQLASYIDNFTQKDHLLVFYAGHGKLQRNKGYWLTSESIQDKRSTWFSTNIIQELISSINNKHTLLIIDACFSGAIFNNRDSSSSPKVINKLLQKDARKAMTSGLDLPVPDKSVFIEQLILALKENERPYITATTLYGQIKEIVMGNTDNIPQYEPLDGHLGGDFIFVKRKKTTKIISY